MPINRGPFNALVDDDGTDLTGSMWNKAAIASVILDPVDAALLAVPMRSTQVSSSTTGVQNAWNPGLADDTVIYWAGTTDLTLNGIVGGAAGRRLTIRNMAGGGNVLVGQNSGSAAAGNAFYNMVTSGPTPIAAFGAATWVHRGDLWMLVSHEQGAWIAMPYAASNYSGNQTGPPDWSVDAGDLGGGSNAYRLSGKTLLVSFYLIATSVANSPTALRIQPTAFGGYTLARQVQGTYWYRDTAEGIGTVATLPAFVSLNLYRTPNGQLWPTTTNNTSVWGEIACEVT